MVLDLFKERISLETMAGWFDKLGEAEQELIALFNIQEADGNLITIKDRFKAKYDGFPSRYTVEKERVAYVRFQEIVRNNIFLLAQIHDLQEGNIMKDLRNLNLYQEETITDYTNTSTSTGSNTANAGSTVTHSRNLVEGTLSGSSDGATMSTTRDSTRKVIETKGIIEKSPNKILDYLDPNTRQMSHTVNVFGGSEETGTISNSSASDQGTYSGGGRSKMVTSNAFTDRMTYLHLELPNLANRFLEKFRILFLC